MSVGLTGLPELHPVPGIRLGTSAAGIRYQDRSDLVVIECAPGTEAAAVFTRNRFCAAPVVVARDHLAQTAPRALLINAGNANAGLGKDAHHDAITCCEALATQLGCAPAEILPFSTGVIGERLPVARIADALPACINGLSETGWAAAAQGIMTTDTVAKGSSRQLDIDGRTVTVTGIAKGAGMIRPDMATTLAFVATDAPLSAAVLRPVLDSAVNRSFNRITVDGDTSTNDACVLLATGQNVLTGLKTATGENFKRLEHTIDEVVLELAQAVVRDAEGATKFITVDVRGGASEADCLAMAYTLAHSPLVKTACFAGDPNWGRVLAAVGRAPVSQLDIAAVSIFLNDVRVVHHGGLDPAYQEARGQAAMANDEITIGIDLGVGGHRATVWTSDLSHEYIRINAEYRT